MPLPPDWERLLAAHDGSLEEYRTAARWLAPIAWMQPLAPGKWTPAEITSHVTEAYRVLLAELGGAGGMKLLGSRLQQLILRHTMLPRLAAGRPFPPGVRAPRETRPKAIIDDQDRAISELGHLAGRFAADLTARGAAGPVRLTHAYFGALSPGRGLQLLTAHNRHHARQLAPGKFQPRFDPDRMHPNPHLTS